MHSLLCCPPLVRFICGRIWCHRVLPAALPAPLSATLSPALLVYLCANVGPQGLLVVRLPAPFHPTLRQSRSRHSNVSPVRPSYRLDECLFFISLVSDPLAIRFSVSSGCARRRSVSTYAAILVLSPRMFLSDLMLFHFPSLVHTVMSYVFPSSHTPPVYEASTNSTDQYSSFHCLVELFLEL